MKKKIVVDEELFWLLEEKRVQERMESIEDLLWLLMGAPKKESERLSDYSINTRIGRQASKDILSVISLMEQGYSYNDACFKVSAKRDVAVQTIYDACTRRLGISAGEFREIVENPEKRENLKQLLSN